MKTTFSPLLSTLSPSRDLSPLARVFAGIIAGSILVLLIHPVSRPFLTGLFQSGEATQKIREAGGHVTADSLPNPPNTVAEAALWMQLGATRINNGIALDEMEIRSLKAVLSAIETGTNSGLAAERRNAFWYQMAAVIHDYEGDDERALAYWLKAAEHDVWQDFQASRLLHAVDDLRPDHRPMAWQYSAAYYQKSTATAEAIYRYASKLMSLIEPVTNEGLKIRTATMRNGALVRDGSRSIENLHIGIEIVDLAALPVIVEPTSKQVALIRARSKLMGLLRDRKMQEELDLTVKQIAEQESKNAFFPLQLTRDRAALMALASVLTNGIGGVLLALALAGAASRLFGEVLTRYSGKEPILTWAPLAILGGVLCFWVFSITLLPVAALAVLAGTLFLAFTPRFERTRHPLNLGTRFSFAVGLVTVVFIIFFSIFLISLSTPSLAIMPSISPFFNKLIQNGVPLGMALLTLLTLLMISPLFGHSQKIATSTVLGLTLRRFGRGLLLVGLAGTVLVTPLAVYVDRQVGNTLRDMISNEQAKLWVTGED
jgi:hypothetical protein